MDVWVDMSSLASGVLFELHGTIIEDICWSHPESDTQYINLAELDGIIKGVNLVVHSNVKFLHLKTDLMCVN